MQRVKVIEWWCAWLVVFVAIVWRLVSWYRVGLWVATANLGVFAFVSFRLAGAVIVSWQDREVSRRLAADDRAKQEASSDAEP